MNTLEKERDEAQKANKNLQLLVFAQRFSNRKTLSPKKRDVTSIDLELISSEIHEDLRRSISPNALMPQPQERRKREAKMARKRSVVKTRSRTGAISDLSSIAFSESGRKAVAPFVAVESEISKLAESSFDVSELLSQLEHSRIEYEAA